MRLALQPSIRQRSARTLRSDDIWAVAVTLVTGARCHLSSDATPERGFGVSRPPLANLASLSYPSGHVAGAATIGVVLSYVASRNRRWPLVVTPFCAILLVLMAVSRVYLDKHWLSDTVGGALRGTAIGLVTCALYEWIQHRGRSVVRA